MKASSGRRRHRRSSPQRSAARTPVISPTRRTALRSWSVRRPGRGRRRRRAAPQGDDARQTSRSSSRGSEGGRFRRRGDARRRGALVARARRAGRTASPRRLGGARRHDRARRGARGALGASRASTRPEDGGTASPTRSTTSTRTPWSASSSARSDSGSASSATRPRRSSVGSYGISSSRRHLVVGEPWCPEAGPRVLRARASSLGAPPEVAYVGDRVDNDVLPAAAAGLVAVHVRRGPWGRLQTIPPAAALGLDDLASLPTR